jgi:hypothetical protein
MPTQLSFPSCFCSFVPSFVVVFLVMAKMVVSLMTSAALMLIRLIFVLQIII